MNRESSRSHSVLTSIIESKFNKDGLWNVKVSRFHIIDLAGSERAKHTDAKGERLKEAGMINKSLSALGNVINSLVDLSEGKARHIHYRDSKLTFLLRDSLGGNSKTLIVANVSPSFQSFGETLSTLKFAQRAKLIKNKAIINEDSSGTVSILKEEIKRLKVIITRLQMNTSHEMIMDSETSSSQQTKEESKEEGGSTLTETEVHRRIKKLEKVLRKNLETMNAVTSYYEKRDEEQSTYIQKLSKASNYEH